MTDALVESPEVIADAVCRRAAVVGTFDPSRLLAEVAPGQRDEAVEDRIFSVLSASIEEVVVGKDVLWRLQTEARHRALKELVARDELDLTIALAKPQAGDRFGQILQATLREGAAGSGLSMQRMSADDLMLQALALDFARSLPTRNTTVAQGPEMDPRILLARKAERRRQDYVAPAKLFGRDRDVAALDSYVADGSVSWPLMGLDLPAGEPHRLRPLLLTGIGGSGKSALVADLMRRTQRQDWSGPIVVCLDFDQKNVALGGEREWLNELTRQIGFARPALDAALSKVRAEARQHLHRLAQQRDGVERLTGTDNLLVVSTMREELQKALSGRALAAETLVLIVDTFEEVLVRSDMSAETISQEPFGLVLAFIDSLSKLVSPNGSMIFGAVRSVVAGRAPPFPDQALSARWFDAHLEVGELDVAAAIDFLRARADRRVFTRARAQRIVEALPRFPLILILLAAFARGREASEIDLIVGTAQGAGVLSAAASTRVLYSRFLDRLKDHTIRDSKGERVVPRGSLVRLAHPGLALNIVTPALIRHVLAVPTGLGEIDDQQAADLFGALSREVWLVERVGANAVRHIPVLRRIMLPMLNGDLTPSENANIAMRETVRAVHRTAAEWYRTAGANDPDAIALAAYHDAFLGEVGILASDQSLVRRVLDIAGDDVSAMPIEARAILRREKGSDEALSVAEAASFPVAQRSMVDAARGARRTRRGTSSRQAILDQAEEDDTIQFEALLGSGDFKVSPVGLQARDQFEVLLDEETSQRIESSFAEANFERVLLDGAHAVAALRDNPLEDPPFDRLGDVTSHWTWKWALSCLATGSVDESMLKWVAAAPHPVNAPSATPPFRVGTLLSLAVATVALGRAPSFVNEPSYRNAIATSPVLDGIPTYSVLEGAPMYSILSLRLRALARYWDKSRALTTLRPFEVKPRLLRLVALWSQIRDASGLSSAYAEMPASLRLHLMTFDSNPPHSSELGLLDECEENVIFSAEGSWSTQPRVPMTAQRALGLLLRGRSPELYDPIRAALGDVVAADSSSFAQAIADIAGLAPFWPTDLIPGMFHESGASLREVDYLLARLVAFLDLAGLISQLFSALEQRTITGRRCRTVAKLVQAYDALLLAPYDAADQLPNFHLSDGSFSGSAV
ncbi:ATP-binding protein [Mesorhizobium sp. M1D.F.Ca.ET.043.01.1.1]|uniref:ATP-binding protein n=1 Tax=Mesorhizobium sp. M1D.F.Ca.ET.043.01.1.1 TaxID=2493669 RepID=UPI000F75350C|nr:ATP-binding protein [Mesorhizobium sp. M1D.F.Ca.ET.043.01.1.1]AZO73500.1 ATP-binding protein [Mesorhizobium sp. M1D.F.Ca.ET.043.01.1.1]